MIFLADEENCPLRTGYKWRRRRSSARFWWGVGLVSMSKGVASAALGRARFLTMVARSRSSVVKLWTGRSADVRLVSALASAPGDCWAVARAKERRATP